MHRLFARLPQILLASIFAISAVGVAAPRDAASGLPTGKRMHKPYTVSAAPADNPATAQPVFCAATVVQPVKVASDPEEGGQAARAAKPGVTDISVSKKTDTASPKLMESAAPASTCPAGQH